MKTYKVILALTLLVGGLCMIRTVQAEDAVVGGGWRVDIVTGTHAYISTTRVKLFKILLSSGTTGTIGDYVQAFSTPPSQAANGADIGGNALFGGQLFQATAAITTPIVYRSTSGAISTASTDDRFPNGWWLGDCESCYVEVPGLVIRQNAVSAGGANQVSVYYKR